MELFSHIVGWARSTPRFLIRDRDEKFGATFDRVAKGVGTRVIKTAVRAPNMNPVGERFVGSLRREALDHVLLRGERQLEEVAQNYMLYFNKARPHQGIGQRIPDGPANDNRVGKSSPFRYSAASITTTIGLREPWRFQRMDEVATTAAGTGPLSHRLY